MQPLLPKNRTASHTHLPALFPLSDLPGLFSTFFRDKIINIRFDLNFQLACIIIIIINPLIARVVGAPQMNLQSVFSIFPCSPLPSGTCRTPGLSIPWCCPPTSSSSALSSSPFHCALQDGFGQTWWTENMTKPLQFASLYDHLAFVWSNCLLDLGTDFLVGNMVFVWDV